MNTMAQHETEIVAPEGVPWLDIIREFDAPPAKVYRAHVDPELAVRWIGPHDLEMTIDRWDARTGGEWAYTHRRGEDAFRFYGSFHELREGVRIVQTFAFEGAPDAVALGIATFQALPDGRTRMVNRSIGSSIEERDAMIASGMATGVEAGYEKLDALLAEKIDN